MKKLLLFLMIPIMLIQSNMTLMICTSFYYNQEYIAKNLCEQRLVANNHCHGQCVLMKKIRAAREKEQDSLKVNFHEAFVFENFTADIQQPLHSEIIAIDFSEYQSNLFPRQIYNALFRPPLAHS